MSKEKKELSKLLERYDNTAEEFYLQMKRYYQSGIVTSVNLPFSLEEVKQDPKKAMEFILQYKTFIYKQPKNLNELVSLLFEVGPVLFVGDKVEVLILDQKLKLEAPVGLLEMDKQKTKQGFTIRIKLLESGPDRLAFEENVNRDKIAEHLKDRLKQSIYLALRTILFDGFSDNPEADLKMSNEISNQLGVVITEAKDVDQVLEAPYNTDLGLRDLEQLYVLHDLMQDEHWWVFNDVASLQAELKEIIYKSRQLRIDSPILSD